MGCLDRGVHKRLGGMTIHQAGTVLLSKDRATNAIASTLASKETRLRGEGYVRIRVLASDPGRLARIVYSPRGAVEPKTAWYIPYLSVVTSYSSW